MNKKRVASGINIYCAMIYRDISRCVSNKGHLMLIFVIIKDIL